MGLLDQLFRHKSDLPGAGSAPGDPAQGDLAIEADAHPEARTVARSLGAIAAAIGLRPDKGMPAEFEIVLGDLLQRAPEKSVWPGSHDARRILRVPAAEITGGLAKGRAELSLARLIALAPDVFRWEPGDSNDLRVRLPLQKLLQQIGSRVSVSEPETPAVVLPAPSAPAFPASGIFGSSGSSESDPVTAHLPSIVWEKTAPAVIASATPSSEAVKAGADSIGVIAAAANLSTPTQPPTIAATAPPVLHEFLQPLHAAAEEPVRKSLELRPHTDVAISTTLRAVILGGRAVVSQSEGASPANPILAPHAPPSSFAPSIILAPAGQKTGVAAVEASDLSPTHPGDEATTKAEADASLPRSPAPSSIALGEGVNFSALQSLFMTDATLDLAGVAAKVATLPGIHACVVLVADGFAQAGHFPAGLDADALRAIVQDPGGNAGESVSRTSVGAVANTTLHRGDRAISVFVRDRVSLSVVLDARGFVAGVRERIARATDYLAGAASAE